MFVIPKTSAQELVFEKYQTANRLLLIGPSGVGKSYMCLFLALKDVLEEKYDKLEIVVFSNNVKAYENVYKDMAAKLDVNWDNLVLEGKITFTNKFPETFSNNSVVLLDEVQYISHEQRDAIYGSTNKILACLYSNATKPYASLNWFEVVVLTVVDSYRFYQIGDQ